MTDAASPAECHAQSKQPCGGEQDRSGLRCDRDIRPDLAAAKGAIMNVHIRCPVIQTVDQGSLCTRERTTTEVGDEGRGVHVGGEVERVRVRT